jgi:hypothetical protein
MSYYHRIEIEWYDDTDQVTAEMIMDSAAQHVPAHWSRDDFLADLRDALRGPLHDATGFNNVWSGYFEDFMLKLTPCFPDVTFLVRGAGEELREVWLREFKNGKITLEHGPFSDES